MKKVYFITGIWVFALAADSVASATLWFVPTILGVIGTMMAAVVTAVWVIERWSTWK